MVIAIIGFLINYLFLPPWNIQSRLFWLYIVFLIGVFSSVSALLDVDNENIILLNTGDSVTLNIEAGKEGKFIPALLHKLVILLSSIRPSL